MTFNISLVARLAIFLVLLLCWSFNVPHYLISNYIGAHFSWPTDQSMKWIALLFEGCLVETVVCLPFVLPLAYIFRRFTIPATCLLVAVFAIRAVVFLPTYPGSIYPAAFVCYQIVCHTLFLVGGTVIARRYLEIRGLSSKKWQANQAL
jgi:hypothetical protein